jgi:hypothetical protein
LDFGDSWNNFEDDINKIYCMAFIKDTIFAGTYYGIFVTRNHGKSWESSSSGFPSTDRRILSFAIVNDYLFTGTTGLGVAFSSDYGNNWKMSNQGLTKYMIRSLLIKDPYIYAGTDSCYLFRRKLSDFGITYVCEKLLHEKTLNIYPNPCTDFLNIEIENEVPSELIIYNSIGIPVLELITVSDKARIDISHLPIGAYFMKYNNSTKTFIKF